jgi:hypothetical protein
MKVRITNPNFSNSTPTSYPRVISAHELPNVNDVKPCPSCGIFLRGTSMMKVRIRVSVRVKVRIRVRVRPFPSCGFYLGGTSVMKIRISVSSRVRVRVRFSQYFPP